MFKTKVHFGDVKFEDDDDGDDWFFFCNGIVFSCPSLAELFNAFTAFTIHLMLN